MEIGVIWVETDQTRVEMDENGLFLSFPNVVQRLAIVSALCPALYNVVVGHIYHMSYISNMSYMNGNEGNMGGNGSHMGGNGSNKGGNE